MKIFFIRQINALTQPVKYPGLDLPVCAGFGRIGHQPNYHFIIMRVPSKTEQEAIPPEVSMEVQIWLDKGWTIIPAKRRGLVLAGQKKMRALDKVGLVIGAIFFLGLFAHYLVFGIVGAVLLLGVWFDYRYNTKAPTKFFPEPGEKTRVMERKE